MVGRGDGSSTAGWAPAALSLANERAGGGRELQPATPRAVQGSGAPLQARKGRRAQGCRLPPHAGDGGRRAGRDAGSQLTAAERRVAQVVLARPQLVGFGTVADLAEAASAGAATVVRLAAKLGFDGFTAPAGVDPARPRPPAPSGRRADP